LFAIPVGLFVAFGIEEPSIQRAAGFKDYLKAIFNNILKRQVAGLFAIGILTFIILYGAIITYNPFLMHQKFGLSAPKIGLIISLSSLTMALFASQAGRLSHRFGKIPLGHL
jgi:MFS family permease